MTTNKGIASAFQYNDEATNPSGSFYVENINGVTIAFSYGRHFPIAIKLKDGVFFTSGTYSNTTGRHKSLILSTLGSLNEDDYKTTAEMCEVVEKVKYNDVKSKAELIEIKI